MLVYPITTSATPSTRAEPHPRGIRAGAGLPATQRSSRHGQRIRPIVRLAPSHTACIRASADFDCFIYAGTSNGAWSCRTLSQTSVIGYTPSSLATGTRLSTAIIGYGSTLTESAKPPCAPFRAVAILFKLWRHRQRGIRPVRKAKVDTYIQRI